jgi:hypothetical protein
MVPAAACCALAFVYPASDNWQAAWAKQHSWADATSFAGAFRPVVSASRGRIFASNQTYVAEYYTGQGQEWRRWAGGIPGPSPGTPRSVADAYYARALQRFDFGTVALFYTTSLSGLPRAMVLSSHEGLAQSQLLRVVADNTGSAGHPVAWLPALTVAMEHDPRYRLVAVGPYDSGTTANTYAIWKRVSG